MHVLLAARSVCGNVFCTLACDTLVRVLPTQTLLHPLSNSLVVAFACVCIRGCSTCVALDVYYRGLGRLQEPDERPLRLGCTAVCADQASSGLCQEQAARWRVSDVGARTWVGSEGGSEGCIVVNLVFKKKKQACTTPLLSVESTRVVG